MTHTHADMLPAVRHLRDKKGWGCRKIATDLGIGKDQALRLLNKLKLEDAHDITASFQNVQPFARGAAPAFLRTVADYAGAIAECWQRSVEAIFETGRLLKAARDALPHGEFLPMIETRLPFGPSTAERLMKIAADERLQKSALVQHLPPSWGTLYELTKLDDAALEAGIASGKIRPDMTRRVLINGARSLMSSRIEPDDSRDFYCTPPWATRALCEHVIVNHGQLREESAWEPACGEGHMSEVLKEYFGSVFASDIFDYAGYPQRISDFLDPSIGSAADWIITNPPFGDLTERFILRALDLARVGVAMFVRCQFLETVGRYERLWKPHPPTLIAFFAERVPLQKGCWNPDGSTATAYCWLVWVKDRAPMAPFWIPPGCRQSLTRADDRSRFAAWSMPPHVTGEIELVAEWLAEAAE